MLDRINRLLEHFNQAGCEAFYVTDPANRFYLSGFSGTTGSLLLARGLYCLLTDFRYTEQAASECPDYKIIDVTGSYNMVLAEILKEHNLVRLGCEGDHLTYNQFSDLKKMLPGIELKPGSGMVEHLRLCKDENEIKHIEEAARLADQAFVKILPAVNTGAAEREIALQLEYLMRESGAEESAFKIIVASGSRSALPHGVASLKTLQRGDLVTFDFGAVYRGYNSDITRTVVIGPPDARQKEIYEIVLEAQMNAISVIKAGVRAADVDQAARGIIEKKGYGPNFGHSTGHGLGLDVHENPRLSAKDETILRSGMVVTVEPGIYLPGWGGVRIEDTVVVEDNGCRILTKTPKEKLLVL
ncbi:M24 family metallopeptidase [Pelotomaculum propionicicum]|uniref:Aminopeptidase YpdF n=1 Tax=Pelotomaculum propionicicum TaxID=258475 RepID=A0A4Y7RIY4_9FIRM|nr:Xaa-Pro peptidase family protein [Pelotomaculum propionicicum]NLI11350.1 aminopeptidase P family protein [Peptococcaceae bacterium]TEB08954.1 Aminopeptidase YpdF [Pelotomaculum propionicicum]